MEKAELRRRLQIAAFIIIPLGLIIVGFVDLRISLGLLLFGWGMNMENKAKSLN
jgi:hypothetical protein